MVHSGHINFRKMLISLYRMKTVAQNLVLGICRFRFSPRGDGNVTKNGTGAGS